MVADDCRSFHVLVTTNNRSLKVSFLKSRRQYANKWTGILQSLRNVETIGYLTAGLLVCKALGLQGPIQSELSVFLLLWAAGQMHITSEYARLVLTIEQVVQMSRMTSGNGSCSHSNDSEEQ